jgi:hypothetical protein
MAYKLPKELLESIAKQMRSALIQSIKADKKVSTGSLINSIKIDIDANANTPSVSIDGNAYYAVIEEGRKPGKYVPISPLKEWIKAKGIETDDAKITARAFAISNAIKKKGIKANPITEKTFKQALPLFDRIINQVMDKDLDKYLEQEFSKI